MVLQGLLLQVLTEERNAQAQPMQSVAQLKHVLSVHNLGVGLSSKSEQATLLCTGDPSSLCS